MLQLLLGDDFCAAQNVTYAHRVFDEDADSWCPVPGGGADALLFAALAVFMGCLLYSRLSSVWTLLAGALFALLSSAVNLNHFSNALTVWLGMRPTFLFFQIFLPPLLLDSAVRIDFFLFKKLAAHTLLFAVVNVVLSTLAFIPLMLWGLGMASSGWGVMDAALFGAMLGSTDAVAVAAILKAGGAPELLSVLLEGESLFNDASSIVLFEVFLKISLEGPGGGGGAPDADLLALLPGLMKHVGYLMISGALAGLMMGVVTRLLYSLLHKRHVPPFAEVAAALAGAYTVYLCTEYYIHGSGVIAVVVYGLYGASTYLYGFSSKGLRTGAFFKFLDVLSFMLNGMVFFYVGSSIVNFFISLSGELFSGGSASALLQILQGLPVILLAMFLLRGGLMWLEAPLLSLLGPSMSWQEVVFSVVGGLRGGLALILVQTVMAAHTSTPEPRLKVVHAQMALWVSAVVLFTLTVNATALGPLMRWLGLNKSTPLQRMMHRGAYSALSQYTHQTIADLRADDDEMLKGVDWKAVVKAGHVQPEHQRTPKSVDSPTQKPQHAGKVGVAKKNKRRESLASTTRSARSSAELSGTFSPTAAASTSTSARPSRLQQSFTSQSSDVPAIAGGGTLTVPLLSRAYAPRRQRYGPDDASDDEEDAPGDIEAGQPQSSRADGRNSSEAFFIASRLHQQDQQLAEHTAAATNCPFLNLSIDPSTEPQPTDQDSPSTTPLGNPPPPLDPSTPSPAAESPGQGAAGSAELGSPAAAGGVGGGGLEGTAEGSGEQEAGEGTPAGGGTAAAEATVSASVSGGHHGPKLKPLQPLIPVGLSDMVQAQRTGRSLGPWQHQYLAAHSAADEASAAAAAVAATQAAMAPHEGPSGLVGSRASFIAAATGATSAAGVLGLRKGTKGADPQPRPAAHKPSGLTASLAELMPKPQQELDVLSELSEDDTQTPEEYLEECRISLLAGLKRHFRFKAAEGLLSKTSLRLLDYACDAALSRPQAPLNVWKECGGELRVWGVTASVAALHLQLRKYQAALLRQRGGCVALRLFLINVLNRCSLLLRRYLGKVAVTALEVALELWLALTVSPVAKLMRHSHTDATALLQEELRDQAAAVWRFIMDRQLEAPDEFASLQTHRVQLAVARRQLAFVERMSQIGAIDELAGEELQELLERRLHRLESRGPDWQNPGIMDVLRRLPFLAAAPEGLLLWLRAYGELKSYEPGQCIIPRQRSSPPGVFIVLLGLVRVEVERPGGRQESRFVGVGGSVGIVPSIIGRDLPGAGLVAAYGQGNALGRGPMLLHLPLRLLATIRQRAAPAIEAASDGQMALSDLLTSTQPGPAGPQAATSSSSSRALSRSLSESARAAADPGGDAVSAAVFAQLLLDMHRQAGVMLLDRMGSGALHKLSKHLEAAAQAVLRYVSQLPPAKALPKLQRLLQPLLGKSGDAADVDLGDLLDAAFDTQHYSSTGEPPTADTFDAGSLEAAAAAAAVAAGRPSRSPRVDMVLDDAVVQLLHAHAVAAAARLRDVMRGASLVTLAPGQPLEQSSTVLLLNGSLRLHNTTTSSSSSLVAGSGASAAASKAASSPSKRGLFRGRSQRTASPSTGSSAAAAAAAETQGAVSAAAGDGQGQYGSMRQYSAPALLAWGPQLFDTMEDRYDAGPRYATAGPSGALLLVTPYSGTSGSSTDEDTSTAPNSPAATAAAGGTASAGSSKTGSGSSSRPQQQQGHSTKGYLRMSSKRLLERSVAPAVDIDEADV